MAAAPILPYAQALEDLARLIGEARRILVFTGAGISTESGIPDFRSPGGLWSRQKPIEFQDFLSSNEARLETWRRKFATDSVFREARPNRGHRAVAELVRSGKAEMVVTQNIDGLHQASGVPEDGVVELHGNTNYALCLDCAQRYEIAELRPRFERENTPPVCECGGWIKTATISFGQKMPEEAMRRAQEETDEADLFLAIGSSLVVYPAAALPELAAHRGAGVVIVNREPTRLDIIADLVVNGAIGEVLGSVVGVE